MSGRTRTKRFQVRKDSVAAARRHVRTTLTDWKLGGLIEDSVLITSELTTNAVNHAKGTGDYFELALRRRNGILVLEVADSYQWHMPELEKAAPDDPSGRGLFIVDTLSQHWGGTAAQPRQDGVGTPCNQPPGRAMSFSSRTSLKPPLTPTPPHAGAQWVRDAVARKESEPGDRRSF
ncbi:ATP-binding protein [Streptomyces sp. Edi2]|uniref:ATP-binding protein n=1 Tax=Streptomyces sp. Edi2 TaxID=3162528 RepID=UPI0033068CB2